MSGLLWPIFWVLVMLGMVVATTVVAMREKKARNEALKKMQPQPLDSELEPGEDPMGADAGFEPGMGDFEDPSAESDFAEVDQEASQK